MTETVIEFVCVASRKGPWPRKRIEWAPALADLVPEFEGWPTPGPEHLDEVLEMNPALRGWGDPLKGET